MPMIPLEAHQACPPTGGSFDSLQQVQLRDIADEVSMINFSKFLKTTLARSRPTGLGITKSFQMEVIDPLSIEPVG
ncbi:MAG: hypothetical protein QOF41_1976 [Methylobacteriaceae bacterium]|nr:hypothetical protein [Methylobacteriaceae bacterium]